jgi:membrane-associated phospholipid phosphatase
MWLLNFASDLLLPVPSRGEELSELKAIMAKAKAEDLARMAWWNVGGPAYRWNEIAIEELLDRFVTLPLAARHLALLHAAIDDAEAVAWHYKVMFKRARPSERDPKLEVRLPAISSPSYPSDFAAGTTAAVQVLASILPDRAGALAARAEEAMRSRLLAGLEYPSDVKAGREIGLKVAARAIERGKRDGSDQTWTGTVPTGPGKWQGTNPIAPSAATWRPWVLARPDELRPPVPPAFDSERTKADLAELKTFKRTPKSNHRAVYWEVYGGARAHALWNEIARLKLLEYGKALDARASARVLALLNIAFLDAAIACWDAKYLYWYIRPSQLDPDLKPVFPPPNHPSYPAAHGCLSTAAATVLASLFPGDADKLLAHGKEAAEARVWAGIHYRFDIDAGQELGRKVAEKVLARAGVTARQ